MLIIQIYILVFGRFLVTWSRRSKRTKTYILHDLEITGERLSSGKLLNLPMLDMLKCILICLNIGIVEAEVIFSCFIKLNFNSNYAFTIDLCLQAQRFEEYPVQAPIFHIIRS